MLGINDLKYYTISDETQKYEEINNKIIKFTKLYFYTMKNHSYQLAQIENKLNQYSIKGEVKIKQLLENQQTIIKELIKIINNILKEIKSDIITKKKEDYIPVKQKNIVMNNNLNIFTTPHYTITKSNFLKNNIKERRIINTNTNEIIRINLNKSVDDKVNTKLLNQKKVALNVIDPKTRNEFNGTLSLLNNVKSSKLKNKKFFGRYLNKEKPKKEENNNNLKHKIIKSMSTSEISYQKKNHNKNNLILKTSNISNNIISNNNNNPIYINNNYTIDEEKSDNIDGISIINERLNSISSSNLNENYGILPHILTKRKKRIKYRVSGSGKIVLTDNNLNMVRVKSAKEIPLKSELYLNFNSSFPNFTITNTSIDKITDFSCNKRSNSTLCFYNGNLNLIKDKKKIIKNINNEIYSVPYIYNGKRIIPTRFTKEVYNSSYKILNKYEKRRVKKN